MNTVALAVGGLLLAAVPLFAQVAPQTLAVPIQNARLVYDDFRQRLLCIGSSGTIQEHDGVSWAVVDVRAPANARVAYDEVRGRAYFSYLELLEYDGHAVRGLGPSSILQTMVVDTLRDRVVGLRPAPNVSPPVLEIVEFANGSWTVAGVFPGSRGGLASAFDRVRGVVVFQTWLPSPSAGFETWEWDGSNLVGPFTDGIWRSAIAFDATRGQVIGIDSTPTSLQTSVWNGSAWSLLPNAVPPSGPASLATDSRRGLVHALVNTAEGRLQLSAWNGTSWQASIAGPMPLSATQMVWDSARGRGVMLGDQAQLAEPREHAEFDGFVWRRPALPAGAPTSFTGIASAFDTARGETVVFGGRTGAGAYSGDTHAWNGTAWRLAATAGPSPRGNASMTYDSARGVIVLIGGVGAAGVLADHWEWDGAVWTQIAATTPMQGGFSGSVHAPLLGYDPVRQVVVAHDAQASTWEFDGLSWSQRVSNGPTFATGFLVKSLVWIPAEQGLVATLVDGFAVRPMKWDGLAWAAASLPLGVYAHDPVRGATYVQAADVTRMVPSMRSAAVAYGSRCGGSGTDTSLSAFGRSGIGNANLHLDLRADARLRPALLGFGLAAGSTPIGNGCEFLLQNPLATRVWFTDAFGFWHQNLPLPNVPALRGLDLFAQGAVLDPASAGGLAMTQGLRLTVGD